MTSMPTRILKRAAAKAPKISQTVNNPSNPRRYFILRSESPYATRRRQHFLRSVTLVVSAGCVTTLYQWSRGNSIIRDVHAEANPNPSLDDSGNKQYVEAPPEKAEIIFENTRKPPPNASKDENRDLISSQHLQVRKSWENPGVWCWGANDGNVAAPGAKENIVKNPRWMPNFEGKLLRDLKLSRRFGAAISEEGDLLQWGDAYFDDDDGSLQSSTSPQSLPPPETREPVTTLRGKNLLHLAISADRILALSASGAVYSLSVSRSEQLLGPKPREPSSWLPFSTTRSSISYRNLTPSSLHWNERVTSVTSGLEHALLLTTSGRVFATASGSLTFPSSGQLGIPGLTWFSRPADQPYDAPQEITPLHGFHITQVAAGDYHSIALDRVGRVFAWGDNTRGQLGIGETSKDTTFFDSPSLLPLTKLYAGTAQKPRPTGVHAGGNTTFLTVDAERVAQPSDADPAAADAAAVAPAFRGLGKVTSDVWAAGHGIWGQLGNGRWTHVAALPTKVDALSGLFEYSERLRRAVPIRMRDISVGANHCAAVMDNVTYTAASEASSENDTNWGADVLWFGNNEFFQLGTGKRNNVVVPTYIHPMDRVAEVREGKRRGRGDEKRFHATPASRVWVEGRGWRVFEQRVVCGRGVSAVYSGV